ncbi:MAG: DUF3801 domain-containing protein [Peptostreptococcaceae bacterium]|nr:DUF3801 domain-containing protein [Peptostreptococcaceae bacterium]
MGNIDHMSEESICLLLRTSNLTLKSIIAVLQKALEILKRENHEKKLKNGKQSIKKLIKKHSDVEPLDNNFSKRELELLKKELQSCGIDFSFKKVARDEYSLFFSAKDRSMIKKGIQNTIVKLKKQQGKKTFSTEELMNKQKSLEQKLNQNLKSRSL